MEFHILSMIECSFSENVYNADCRICNMSGPVQLYKDLIDAKYNEKTWYHCQGLSDFYLIP